MSLLKYRHYRGDSVDGGVHWTRASIDGAPFRGREVPLLREEEFEQFSERVKDAKVKVFKLWIPEDLLQYQDIVDKCVNGWWTLLRDQPQPSPANDSFSVLCIWCENYIEVPPERVNSIVG